MNGTNKVHKRMAVILSLTIIYEQQHNQTAEIYMLHVYICAFSIILNVCFFIQVHIFRN